jgi:hypothetical protein
MTPLPLTAVFEELPDPRRETANKLHRLTDILTVATGPVIGGPSRGRRSPSRPVSSSRKENRRKRPPIRGPGRDLASLLS